MKGLQSKSQLKEYILASLGSPAVNVEITDFHLDIAIDKTLEFFFLRAFDGIEERFLKVRVNQGEQQVTLPDSVIAILNVEQVAFTDNHLFGDLSTDQYITIKMLYDGKGKMFDLVTYELTKQFMATLDIMLKEKLLFDFNPVTKIMHFGAPIKNSMNILIHYYRTLDIEYTDNDEISNVFNHLWVKKMAIEQARYQWGSNFVKYSGSTLPNNLQLNSDGILALAKENIEKLLEELKDNYELPYDFMIG